MSKQVKDRLLNLTVNIFNDNAFALCLMAGAKGFADPSTKGGMLLHYVVPENLCRKYVVGGVTTKPQFSGAAMMALFDELTAYDSVYRDKAHRPGMSIHLETEVVKNVHEGDEVIILTHTDKSGKTVGFQTMEILDKSGDLVARGRHIKYLPMGRDFNIATHPLVLPWTLRHLEKRHQKRGAPQSLREQFTGEKLPLPAGYPAIDGLGRVFDVLGLKELPRSQVPNVRPERNHSMSLASNNGRVAHSTVKGYSMTVEQMSTNPYGKMHGGAVGCAVEQACLLSRSDCTSNAFDEEVVYDLACYVRALDVRYISPVSGELVITATNDIHAPLLLDEGASVSEQAKQWRARSIGKVLSKSTGAVLAEYVCHWGVHQ